MDIQAKIISGFGFMLALSALGCGPSANISDDWLAESVYGSTDTIPDKYHYSERWLTLNSSSGTMLDYAEWIEGEGGDSCEHGYDELNKYDISIKQLDDFAAEDAVSYQLEMEGYEPLTCTIDGNAMYCESASLVLELVRSSYSPSAESLKGGRECTY